MKTTYATYTLSGKEFDIYNNDFAQKNEYRFKSYFQSLADFTAELIKDKSQKPVGNVYVATTCKIPRDKIKSYFAENNLTKTTRTYLADTVLVDLESIDRIFKAQDTTNWVKGYMISSEDVLKHPELFKNSHGSNWGPSYVKTHEAVLKGVHDVFVRSWRDDLSYVLEVFPEAEEAVILSYPTGDLLKTLELMKFLKANPSVKVVFDTALNEDMTSEGIEMDDDIEKQVIQMLKSRDISDTKLAIEICSNFDLEKSLYRIANMFNAYKSRFVGKQSMLTKTSYKQIDAYIRSKGINWMGDRDKFLSDMYTLYKGDEKLEPLIKEQIRVFLQHQLKFTKLKLTDISLA
jgi:hypothetical protein